MRNQWTITEDHIEDGRSVGTRGPRSVTLSTEEIIEQGFPFKLYDDDGNLYYEGYSTTKDDESAFGPLWNFGMPNAGCSYIQYKGKSGNYETL